MYSREEGELISGGGPGAGRGARRVRGWGGKRAPRVYAANPSPAASEAFRMIRNVFLGWTFVESEGGADEIRRWLRIEDTRVLLRGRCSRKADIVGGCWVRCIKS